MDTEYLQSLDDEIGADVYFYHNKISDKIDVFTVGCEISQWDGEKIANLINFDELTNPNGYILFNTCAVTESANTVCKRVAKRLKEVYSNRIFYFMGCGVNYDKEYYKQFGIPISNEDKFNILKYGCHTKSKDKPIHSNRHREVGFVKIEDGCYNNCAYCVIHKIRPHYMVPYEKIKKEIRMLLNQGKRDIQLIGTEIASYHNNGMDLTSLCKKILSDFPKINNIIIGAIDPASKQVDSLIELIKSDNRVFNSIYLCTQSCCDTILKSMRRRHNVKRLEELNKLADGKVDFVYQLIVGFPGETEKLFLETVNNIKRLKPIDIDTIPFSRRENTDAYNMPNQIDEKTISERERILYNAVKNYSHFDDENQLRAMMPMNKRHIDNFMSHAEYDLRNKTIIESNLYGDESFKETFDKISDALQEHNIDDLVVITTFDKNKDMYDMDVNIKLLTSIFGVKVITKIILDDELIDFMADGYYTPENFAFRFCTYLSFDFKKLNKISNEELLKLFKNILIYGIDDISVMLEKLFKSGNMEYFKYISDNIGISI
jgi:threonylcarbamoyladenosine tRNA methylthiotransferase MtaB